MIFQTVCIGVSKSGLAIGNTKTLRPDLRRSALPVKKECEKLGQGLFLIIPNVPHGVTFS